MVFTSSGYRETRSGKGAASEAQSNIFDHFVIVDLADFLPGSGTADDPNRIYLIIITS
jgi:hypothetical protein